MNPINARKAATTGALLATGVMLTGVVPKPEPRDAHGIAPIWSDERPGEAGAGVLGFEIAWSTIDAGGGTSTGSGGFELSGTIGQPDAGNASAGSFELSGGYWTAGIASPGPVCLGDLNGDGLIDADDLGILLGAFGTGDGGDLNNDGITDADDLGILLGAFGSTCP